MSKPDWEAIESAYRAGVMSLREIASQHGISEGAIRKRAKRDEWSRDLNAKVKERADDLVRKAEVRKQVRSETVLSERVLIEATAEVIATVRMEHRGDNGAKKEGDIIVAISAGTGGIAVGTAVKFDGDDNQYMVVAATSSSITIGAPGLRQDLADQATVTVLSEFAPNVAFDRNAFLLACRTPAMPKGGDTADDVMNVTDPVSGITFQIALYRQYRQVRYEVGVAWGVASVQPEHSTIIMG